MKPPKWSIGMRRLMPGVYVDTDLALHFDDEAICESMGVPYTKANAAVIAEMAEKVVREQFPTGDVRTIHVEHAEDER